MFDAASGALGFVFSQDLLYTLLSSSLPRAFSCGCLCKKREEKGLLFLIGWLGIEYFGLAVLLLMPNLICPLGSVAMCYFIVEDMIIARKLVDKEFMELCTQLAFWFLCHQLDLLRGYTLMNESDGLH